MPEWLSTSLAESPVIPVPVLAWRIGTALLLGLLVALLHKWARRGDVSHPALGTTLVLLAAIIAMATQVIGDNVARAFSLVGALSVVRFRTIVRDTQDTAFVIFAVVVGMSAGANHLAVGLVGIALIGACSLFLWPPHRPGGRLPSCCTLTLRTTLDDAVRGVAEGLLATSAERFELTSASTAKQGAAFDLTYKVRLRPETSPARLMVDLHAIEGVEGVDIKRAD
jgi:hypothetical protein